MKKFIVASLAIAVAALSQAATVEWMSGDLASLVTSEMKNVTAYYYVINEATYTELSGKSQEVIYDAYKDQLDSADETVAMNAFGEANWTQENASDPAYVVAIYKADSVFGGSYALAGAVEYSYQAANNAPEGFGEPDIAALTNLAIGQDLYENNNNSWAAVPEPTSIALLVLGLAAVGMKRKVA